MKKIKILSSIVLTTILATSAVLAWTDLWTVSDSDTLTSTLWNAIVWKINENGDKLVDIYTKTEVDTLISNSSELPSGTYFFSIYPSSWTTTNILQISTYSTSTMAVAKASYVQIYSWAWSGIWNWEIVASTRRSNSNTIWTNINDQHILTSQTQTTKPVLFWDNWILKITTTSNNAWIYTIQVTIANWYITEL